MPDAPHAGTWAVPDAVSGDVSGTWRPVELMPDAPVDGWLVPVPRARPEADAAAAARVAARRAARPLRLPTPLRPLTLTDVVDASYAVLKARPGTVALLALVVVLPTQFLNTTVQGEVAAAVSPIVGPVWGDAGESDWVAAAIAWASWSFAYLLLGAALARLMSAWYAGADLSFGDLVPLTVRAFPALAGAWLVALVPKAASLVSLGLLTPFVAGLFVMIAPAVAVEGHGVGGAIRRSVALARRRPMFVGLTLVGVALAEWFLQLALVGIPWMVADAALPEAVEVWVVAAAAVAARLVTASAAAAAPMLLYLDARVRAEGLDLQLAAGEALPAAPS